MHPRRPRLLRLASAAPLLALLAGACIAQEWTPLREEAEMISLSNARRICDDYAEREATRFVPLGQRHPGDRDRVDRSEYARLFRRCMRHQGWELRPREDAADAEGGASDG